MGLMGSMGVMGFMEPVGFVGMVLYHLLFIIYHFPDLPLCLLQPLRRHAGADADSRPRRGDWHSYQLQRTGDRGTGCE